MGLDLYLFMAFTSSVWFTELNLLCCTNFKILLKIDHWSICVISGSISPHCNNKFFVWVGLSTCVIYPTKLSFLFYLLLYCVCVYHLPSFYLFVYVIVWSLVKYHLTVGQLSLFCPPILESNGKNVVMSSLPFISLKDFYNSLWGFLVHKFALPCSAFVVIVLGLSLL